VKRSVWAAAMLFAAAVAPLGPPPAHAAPAAEPFTGTWDLTWRTRKGEVQRGYLVLRQTGARLSGEVHGQGSLKAVGTVDGDTFALHGRRMGAPFRISGRLRSGRLVGSVKVLSVDRPFMGARRGGSAD
jgi:hypothetical protein